MDLVDFFSKELQHTDVNVRRHAVHSAHLVAQKVGTKITREYVLPLLDSKYFFWRLNFHD